MTDSYTTKTGEWVGDDSLPTRINATKVVTYTVADIVAEILSERESSVWVDANGQTGGKPETLEVTLEDVLERIEDNAKYDLGCSWGHTDNLDEVIFTNDEGIPL